MRFIHTQIIKYILIIYARQLDMAYPPEVGDCEDGGMLVTSCSCDRCVSAQLLAMPQLNN